MADTDGLAGPLFALGASASLAVGNVVLKRIGMLRNVLVLTAWQLVLGGLPLLAISALVERGTSISWSPAFVAILVGLALGGTALPYLVWNAGPRGRYRASHAVPVPRPSPRGTPRGFHLW